MTPASQLDTLRLHVLIKPKPCSQGYDTVYLIEMDKSLPDILAGTVQDIGLLVVGDKLFQSYLKIAEHNPVAPLPKAYPVVLVEKALRAARRYIGAPMGGAHETNYTRKALIRLFEDVLKTTSPLLMEDEKAEIKRELTALFKKRTAEVKEPT